MQKINRRALLGVGAGTVALAGTGFGVQQALAEDAVDVASTPDDAASLIKTTYTNAAKAAGGWWKGYISVMGADGKLVKAVDKGSDDVLEAWSCNKVPVAAAILDQVDSGKLALDQLIEVTEDIIAVDGDGIFNLDGAYPSKVTLGHVLANMLTVSDDTAVRLCGTLMSGPDINKYLKAKGFPKTQVEPLEDNPNRFYLGKTTPKESHELWQQLLAGDLLSKESTKRIFDLTRSPVAFTDGIRRNMSTNERLRIATKAGWLEDQRNETGVIYDAKGAPVVTYMIFAGDQGDPENFGATHPAVEARAKMGRDFLDIIDVLAGSKALSSPIPRYEPQNG